ncbi:hypothetical protein F5148DRAFT_1288157 [Russula earlei]|uniref:Uncharacterized protein n=1 Tax=Russula earlei TaxID=71964 RepID=A0ACC0U1M4_9AGAM|nr:hypothetical protein F5148DRAFT_1288157 [Russula earlei]
MSPVPLSPYSIHLILRYISPPSQLTSPIPPNLLSPSLLQRHSLLEISPEDPSSYLSWPSSGRDRAIQLLESLPMPLDELAPDFLVGYTVDREHAYAHVHVKPTGDDGLRLVFEWDGEESWKYHNSNVMPFPPATRPSPSEALADAASDPISLPGEKKGKDGNGDGDSDHDDDDDDYWDSYGAGDDIGPQPLPSSSKNDADASEDAYWAQYASVQGTADSTIPSPVHKRTRGLEAIPIAQHISREETISILNGDIRSRLRDPKAPPSPTTLTHRLTTLSPRRSNMSNMSPLSSGGLPEPGHEDIPGATDDDTESPSSSLDDENSWGGGALQGNRSVSFTIH